MRVLLAFAFLCAFLTGAGAQALNPGDTIAISVSQDPKLDRQVVIGPTGMISFPLAGQIKAGGETPQAIEAILKDRLKDKYAAEPEITVTLVAIARPDRERERMEDDLKPRIFITGEVSRPGPYIMRTKTNVMQAIALSGGLGPFASKRRIQIRRQVNGTEDILYFDYKAFYSNPALTTNWPLRPGDVVIVPERNIFEMFD